MKSRLSIFVLGLVIASTAIPSAKAAVIFSTYTEGNSSGTASSIHSASGKGISFVMPATLQPTDTTSYTLNSVQLLLKGSEASSVIRLALYSNDGSNTPGTQLTTFSATPFTLTSTFTADTQVSLQANTAYWVTFYGTESPGTSMQWGTSSTLPSPASSVGVALGSRVLSSASPNNTSNPSAWSNTATSVNNAFIVNATAVPEPGTWALVALGGMMVMIVARRRKLACQ